MTMQEFEFGKAFCRQLTHEEVCSAPNVDWKHWLAAENSCGHGVPLVSPSTAGGVVVVVVVVVGLGGVGIWVVIVEVGGWSISPEHKKEGQPAGPWSTQTVKS